MAQNMELLDTKLKQFDEIQKTLFAYSYAMQNIEFDGETRDPKKAVDGRVEAMTILDSSYHKLLCSDTTTHLVSELLEHTDELDDVHAAELRVIKRDIDDATCINDALQQDYTRTCSQASVVWKEAKNHNDWESFAPYLDKIVSLKQEMAHAIDSSREAYDVWLDYYEHGTSRAFYDRFFDEVKDCVIPLVHDIQKAHVSIDTSCISGSFDPDKQWELGKNIVELQGLDMDALTLGKTEHPFSDALTPQHAFIATHIYENDVMSNVFSMLHEGGHAIYEQGIDPSLAYTILRGGVSMGIHESQSRFFENYIGRSRAFATPLLELMQKSFSDAFNSLDPETFWKAYNKVEPSLIRVEADELTYPLHVIIRYEIEQLLMSGEAHAKDVPGLWNERYKTYLGVEVPDDTHGALQDVHWSGGSLGYFPTYALGSAYGAQYLAKMQKDGIDFENLCASADLAPIRTWLKENIWQFGRAKEPSQIVRDACGEDFDASYYTDYLTKKFSALYKLV